MGIVIEGQFMPRYEGPLDDPETPNASAAPKRSKVKGIDDKRLTLPFDRNLDEDILHLDRIARGVVAATPTPLNGLNDALDGGFWAEPYFLIGNTGVGKTQLALQFLHDAVKAGVPGCYISLEVPRNQVVCRVLSIAAGVDWSPIYRGLDKPGLEELKAIAPKVARYPLHFANVGWDLWSYENLAGVAQEMGATYPNERVFIVLDFLQIVGGAYSDEDIRSKVRHAAYTASRICDQMDATVLVLSATARDKYKLCDERQRAPKEKLPEVGAGVPVWLQGVGKESGEIEFAASNQIVITVNKDGQFYLAIAKSRAGRQMWVPVKFDGLRYTDV